MYYLFVSIERAMITFYGEQQKYLQIEKTDCQIIAGLITQPSSSFIFKCQKRMFYLLFGIFFKYFDIVL